MAAKDPHHAQAESLDYAIPLERLERVGRARWIVTTASGQQGGNTDLVTSNQQHAERSHFSVRNRGCPATYVADVDRKILKGRVIRIWFGPNQEIDTTIESRQEGGSDKFAQTSLHSVALYDSSPVFGNDHSYPWMRQQGSRCPGFKALGLDPLPCTSYNLEIAFPCQPQPTRETQRARRRRISSVVGP